MIDLHKIVVTLIAAVCILMGPGFLALFMYDSFYILGAVAMLIFIGLVLNSVDMLILVWRR